MATVQDFSAWTTGHRVYAYRRNYLAHYIAPYYEARDRSIMPAPPMGRSQTDPETGITIETHHHLPHHFAFMNHGRWMSHCEDCGSFFMAPNPNNHRSGLHICPACPSSEWKFLKFPNDWEEIEAVYNEMPGRNADMLQNHLPHETIEDARAKLQKAQDKVAAGELHPRTHSIGVAHTWAVGEALTVRVMNNAIKEIQEDLAGRNDPTIQFEGNVEVGGDGHVYIEPRTSVPSRDGALSYDAANKTLRINASISGITESTVAAIPDDGTLATGSIAVYDDTAEGKWHVLPAGANGQVLTSNGPGVLPTWQTPSTT